MGMDPSTALKVESRSGLYVAEFLLQSTDWMVGDIPGHQFENDGERKQFALTVMNSIREVSVAEAPYSSCTDGRWRLALEDGQPVPVREQAVGADVMTLFIMAEALGERFYRDPNTSVAQRMKEVIEFARQNKIKVSTHIGCGAAGSFLTVIGNSAMFVEQHAYTDRQKQLLPAGMYDISVHRQIANDHQRRLAAGLYTGYSPELVTNIVRAEVGPHAIEKFRSDGAGVHGHLERSIVRLHEDIEGVAVSPNDLYESAEVQVFGYNARRLDHLARLYSRGTTESPDYLIARIAGEDFASAGHGTLATGMETLVIRKAA